MAFPYPCHVCGEPGQLLRTGSEAREVYRCRTLFCIVIEFDRGGTRTHEGPTVPRSLNRRPRSAGPRVTGSSA